MAIGIVQVQFLRVTPKQTNKQTNKQRERKRDLINMKTQDFVKALATESGVTQKVARENLDAFKAVVVAELQKGGSVELQGFVSFTTEVVAERTARNPKTGEPVTVPAHTKARASLSKTLRKI